MAFFSQTLSSFFGAIIHAIGVMPIVENPSGVGKNLQGDANNYPYVTVQGLNSALDLALGSDVESASNFVVYTTLATDKDLTVGGTRTSSRRIIIGTAGIMVVTPLGGGGNVTLPAAICTAGAVLDLKCTAIVASGSTAANVLVMW